jgi:uncharacterized membrane protein YoaT (DUF817 family)
MNQISPTDYEVAAQFAHFFTAAFFVSQFGRLGLKWLIVSAIGMLSFAAVKELVYDAKNENPLLRGTSLLDFFMYLAGIASAVGLYFA